MEQTKIVTLEEIGRGDEEWNCYPCSKQGVMKPADFAEVNGGYIVGMCADHAKAAQS